MASAAGHKTAAKGKTRDAADSGRGRKTPKPTGLSTVASTAVAAASGFVAMVATTLLPGISQVYWIWSISAATGKVPEPMTMLCVTWLGLFFVWVYARDQALRRKPDAKPEVLS